MKQEFTASFKSKNKNMDDNEESKGAAAEDDLAQITGGKEAEVDQYKSMLDEITESSLI